MKLAFSVLFIVIASSSLLKAQDRENIRVFVLEQHFFDTIHNYHVVSVVDERGDTSAIGFVRSNAFSNKKMEARLLGGTANCISNFVSKYVIQNTSGPAVELHISRFDVSEKPDAIKERATLKLSIAFYVNGKFMMEFGGKPEITAMDATLFLEELMRQSIRNALKEFDDWLLVNKTE